MKKVLLSIACMAMMVTSCTTVRKSATQRDVTAPVMGAVIADLEVSNQKIVYSYIPTRSVRKGGYDNCVNTAIREALSANGNGDVLVETQEAVVEYKGLISKKIKSITLTGYPAYYKNFKSVDANTLKESIRNNGLPIDKAVKTPSRPTWSFLRK